MAEQKIDSLRGSAQRTAGGGGGGRAEFVINAKAFVCSRSLPPSVRASEASFASDERRRADLWSAVVVITGSGAIADLASGGVRDVEAEVRERPLHGSLTRSFCSLSAVKA